MKVRRVNIELKSKHPIMQVVGEIEADVYDTDRIKFSPGDVVIDIGAHVGAFSCYMAEAYPQVMIKAFEPVPETYMELLGNAAKYENIATYNMAVDVKEDVTIQHRPHYGYCSSSYYALPMVEAEQIKCPAMTLDQVIEMFGNIKMLKMDCEGAEWDLLLQCKSLDKIEYLSMELHRLEQYAGKEKDLKQKLSKHFSLDKLSIHVVDKVASEGLNVG